MEPLKNANKQYYQEEPLIKKNIDFYNDKEILIIQQKCLKMGFDLNMINKVIFYYNIRRENQIIDYLIKDENGYWHHPFIPNLSKENDFNNNIINSNPLLGNNRIMNNVLSRVNSISSIKENLIQNSDDLCEICGESKETHLIKNFIFSSNNKLNTENTLNNDIILNIKDDEESNIINTNNNIINNNEVNENENICPICLDSFENPIEIENCKHKLCEECFNSYLTDLITKNNIDNIPCPYKNCKNISIKEEFFSKYISEQTYFKYRQFKAQNEIARDPKKFFCPYCDSYSLIENDLEKYNNNNPQYVKSTLKCKNNHEFCSCGRTLHEGDCYKEDKNFKELMKKENIKQCPKCGFLIKKNKGCNHITCGNPLCKYEFCWICMKESIPDHYKYGPCAGMQFIEPDSIMFTIKNDYPTIYCIYSFFNCIFYLFIILLALFILPCITFIFLSYLIIFNENNRNGIHAIPRKCCIHVIYFLTISCIFIFAQSIFYMFWIFIFSILSCCLFGCILNCFLRILKLGGNRNQRDNEIELENINNNNV